MRHTHLCYCGAHRTKRSGRFYLGRQQCIACDGIVSTAEERRQSRQREYAIEQARRLEGRVRAKGGLDPVTGQTSGACTWCGAHTHRPHHPMCPELVQSANGAGSDR